MRRIITILILINNLICQNTFAQAPFLRRICTNPNTLDNELNWSNTNSACTDFKFYLIWGRNGNTGAFVLIDTVKNISAGNYIHANVNSSNWYYFLERRDSCGPIFNHYSDTLLVDTKAPEETEFDSVSVDPTTNLVRLGWPSNKSPDFDNYNVFLVNGTNYNALTPPLSGIKDTFFTDAINDASAKSLSYAINAEDSCGNPTSLIKKHSTIFLEHTIDTCLRQFRLSWSHYVGWNTIEKYYIYQKTGAGAFQLIDSVPGNINTYSGKYSVGNTEQLYVRAVKGGNPKITSSSNRIQFSTPTKVNPSYISINYISSKAPISKELSFSFHAEQNADVSGYLVSIYDSNMVLKESINLSKADIDKDIRISYPDNFRWKLTTAAKDYCNNVFFWGDTSGNIVLTGADFTSSRSLNWNTYYKWDTGVEKYLISRGTGNDGAYQLAAWEQTNDTFRVDSEIISDIENEGICYFVEAHKQGTDTIQARSNMVCLSTSFLIFIPNAFAPNGINTHFRPEGSSIDYNKSTITIFNRWGQEVYSGIVGRGWSGIDNSGNTCSADVYHFNLEIISNSNEKQTRHGYVTLLR